MRPPLATLLATLLVPLALAAGCGSHEDVFCSPASQKASVGELMSSWYLYPDLLATVDPTDPKYPTVQDYLDALTTSARAADLDRGWTYATTAAQQQAFFDAGTSVGFGVGTLLRADASNVQHLLISQVFPGSAAADAGFARGDEILAIGDTPDALVDVQTLLATTGVGAALGPSTEGVTRSFRVLTLAAATEVRTATKRTYGLDPVPAAAPVVLSQQDGTKVGYVALRTFISPADAQLQSAFSQLRAQGVQGVIVDLRYNGGGLISTADLLANLLGGARATSEVMFGVRNNAFHADQDQTVTWAPIAPSISPTRVAFITTGATASASELVPNVLEPWFTAPGSPPRIALVGARTYGKPVGQRGFQLQRCGTVIYLVSIQLVNSESEGGYYEGLPDASGNFSGPLCAAPDDLTHDPWDAAEASTAAAMSWLATGTCPPAPPIAAKPSGPTALKAAGTPGKDIYPESPAPDEAQRNVRGLF